MNKQEFELILQEGETHKIEFKENIDGMDREMVAFANSSGGRIILGVSDDGTIKGIRVTNKLKSQIQDIANNCEPKVNIKVEEFKNTLIVHVPEGKDKPYMCKKGFFIRMGPNSQKLTRNEILKFAIHEGRVRYDEQINPKFNFKEDFDEKRFLAFLKRAGITANLPFENILINMNLAEKEKKKYCFKSLVSLFFSENIRKFNSSAYTTCILFKGKNRSHVIDRKDFDGNLIEQVEDAVKFVEKNTLLTYQIKGLVRKEIPQYPIDALREGIVNAVMHRDYFETGSNVFVYIYDDFIEIVNPGGLFGINKEQLGKICARRNELIADLFKTVGFVEKAGTGIQRMEDAMRKARLKEPKIEVSENFFTIIFYGHKKRELEEISLGEETLELNERQKKAVDYIKKKGKITSREYRKITGIGKVYAVRELNELVQRKILIKKGKGRGIHYLLSERLVND